MRLPTIARLFLCAVLLIQPIAAFAFETDQYNLPPKPLADIGDEVFEYTEQNLRKAVSKINAEILLRQSCLESNSKRLAKTKCNSPENERAKLGFLRSEDAIAREVYNLLGGGIPPFTRSGSWMDSHHFSAQPARYKTGYEKSIFFIFPTNYITISPTVNIYGSHFGTDKIAHFFQQGYTYYKIYNRALAEGLSTEKAARKAIRWGQKTERTYYGTLVSGVYSNADLCANYVGMKFYQGLTQTIKIGNETRPAVLLLQNGVWTFNESANLRKFLIKPFLSEHLNEALNPSIFTKYFGLRSYVRRTVRKQSCKQWLNQHPNFSQTDFNVVSRSLRLWNGEDYGFTESENFVTISNTCFAAAGI
ncbi:MAG: hypothetical protein LC768_01600 [Acidobacteria bacterium]|nr:hypothetical protein [Acidobacteriota bacterium]MCA1637026.1 hypothetical protein [Acidobacteriota bacterium]